MNVDRALSELSALSVDERLRIVQMLWDSIPPEAEVTVTPEQGAELQRRMAAHQADPNSALTREELERRLRECLASPVGRNTC